MASLRMTSLEIGIDVASVYDADLDEGTDLECHDPTETYRTIHKELAEVPAELTSEDRSLTAATRGSSKEQPDEPSQNHLLGLISVHKFQSTIQNVPFSPPTCENSRTK
jgi:hypothetical protein